MNGKHQAAAIPTAAKARLAALRAEIVANPRAQQLAGEAWEGMSLQVRTTLVMLGATQQGDPRSIARQPWRLFTDKDRASMATIARTFKAECSSAEALH